LSCRDETSRDDGTGEMPKERSYIAFSSCDAHARQEMNGNFEPRQ